MVIWLCALLSYATASSSSQYESPQRHLTHPLENLEELPKTDMPHKVYCLWFIDGIGSRHLLLQLLIPARKIGLWFFKAQSARGGMVSDGPVV